MSYVSNFRTTIDDNIPISSRITVASDAGAGDCFNATLSLVAVLTRVGHQVYMNVTSSTTAEVNASVTTFTTAIPAEYRPARNQLIECIVYDNSANAYGVVTVASATGTLVFGVGATGGAFSGANNRGVPSQTIIWSVI